MHPFFTGVWDGAIGKPPQLYYGARRTAGNLGFQGAEAYSAITFHNSITAQAMRAGLNVAVGHHPSPTQLAELWGALPTQAQLDFKNWAWGVGGQLVGGSAISAMTSKVLVDGFKVPRQAAMPVMFVLSTQGAMAALWRDA
ncbi:MAG: hypothetical protein AAF799_22520 [Myxococcota bacterium]